MNGALLTFRPFRLQSGFHEIFQIFLFLVPAAAFEFISIFLGAVLFKQIKKGEKTDEKNPIDDKINFNCLNYKRNQ